LVIAGTIADPSWGSWTLAGTIDRTTQAVSGTLKSTRQQVTQSLLQRLPFVSPAVWQEVQVFQAQTPVDAALQVDPQTQSVHYRLELNPERTSFHVSAIDLKALDARGKLVIEDGVVKLRDVRGRAAEGEFAVSANLEFNRPTVKMHFAVEAQRLEVRQLPANWKLPVRSDGRLSGYARLDLVGADGRVRTSGGGQGEFTGVPTAGHSATVSVKLRAEGSGFRFTTD